MGHGLSVFKWCTYFYEVTELATGANKCSRYLWQMEERRQFSKHIEQYELQIHQPDWITPVFLAKKWLSNTVLGPQVDIRLIQTSPLTTKSVISPANPRASVPITSLQMTLSETPETWDYYLSLYSDESMVLHSCGSATKRQTIQRSAFRTNNYTI